MPLSALETKIRSRATERRAALLEDLRLHVALPTGLGNTAALDETRERLTGRLKALGAGLELVPGDPRPDWLDRGSSRPETPPAAGRRANAPKAGWDVPPTAVCRRGLGGGGAGGAGASGGSGVPRILLSGHLDTVHDPQGTFRDLSIAPGGKTATGPGCVDMKGGLVVAVAALEVLEECGVPASWSFVLNSDEETGSYHSDRALQAEADRHDVALVFEPALPDGSLVVSRAGSGQFRLECYGKAAHVGRDFATGVSAVNDLARALAEIEKIADVSRGLIANVGPVGGGLATNVVPDYAWAAGNVRFFTPEGEKEIAARLEAVGAGGAGGGGLPRRVLYRSFNRPPKPLTPRTQKLAEAARAVAEDLGQAMPFKSTGGVCDGNIFQVRGLPTIDTLGVRGGGLHTPEEWVELDSLVDRCALAAILISRLHEGGVP